LYQTLQIFDNKNADIIAKLCISFKDSISGDTNYNMNIRRDGNLFFNYRDESGKGAGYFTPAFSLNHEQKTFIHDAVIGNISYYTKTDCFAMELWTFNYGDSVIQLVVYDNGNIINASRNGTLIFNKSNRFYFLTSAW